MPLHLTFDFAANTTHIAFHRRNPDTMSDQTTFEGHVTFPSRGDNPYRYKITATSDTVSFWIEDRKTKNQWCVRDLELLTVLKLPQCYVHSPYCTPRYGTTQVVGRSENRGLCQLKQRDSWCNDDRLHLGAL